MVKGFGSGLENLREKFGYFSMKLSFTANMYGAYEREDDVPIWKHNLS